MLTQHIANKLAENIRNGVLTEAEFLLTLRQLTEEQKVELYEVCLTVQAAAITELMRLEEAVTAQNSLGNCDSRNLELRGFREKMEAIDKLCEMITFFDEHKIRGAIRFNKRFLNQ